MTSRRRFIAFVMLFVASGSCGLTSPPLAAGEKSAKSTKQRVYFGTYTRGKDQGIFVAELDLKTGKVSKPRPAGAADGPSFLAIHPTQKFLYAVAQIDGADGKKTGGVVAFSVNKDGSLTKLNEQDSQGAGPCHLTVDKAGKNVLVANYGGGTVAVLPIDSDGKLKPASSTGDHKGTGTLGPNQRGPHAHSINLDAGNRYAFAADLGLDQILVYKFDAEKGKITPNTPHAAKVARGAGPRHFAFHPSGKFAYVINEIGNTMTAFSYDAEKGKLTEIQTISTLPKNFEGKSYTAEVVVHPSGKFVYGSNRGHDSLVIYKVDPKTGKLTVVGHEPTQGKFPRNFAIDPTGSILFAENQNTNNIVLFRVDGKTGKLKPTGQVIPLPSPVCVRFIPLD